MPCSRTPQWNVRPLVVRAERAALLERRAGAAAEVGGAADQIGHAVAIAWSARPEAWRVASGPLSGVIAGSDCSQPSGSAPESHWRSSRAASPASAVYEARLARHRPRAAAPRRSASRQWSSASSGT